MVKQDELSQLDKKILADTLGVCVFVLIRKSLLV